MATDRSAAWSPGLGEHPEDNYLADERGCAVKTYPVILADPPWAYYGSPNKWAAAGKFYPLMDDEELSEWGLTELLPRLDTPGVVFLWATSPCLDKALRLIESCGLHYRGVAFVWVKTRSDGQPIGAQGVRPSIVKPLTEFVLCASTERKGRPLPLASESVVQTVFAPRREHSRKPLEVMYRIEMLYPHLPRLEMFARPPHQIGWDVWGDESIANVTVGVVQGNLAERIERAARVSGLG